MNEIHRRRDEEGAQWLKMSLVGKVEGARDT